MIDDQRLVLYEADECAHWLEQIKDRLGVVFEARWGTPDEAFLGEVLERLVDCEFEARHLRMLLKRRLPC